MGFLLATDRLTLRTPRPDDAADLAERRSDPSTAEYQAWSVPYPLEKAERLCREMAEQDGFAPDRFFQMILERRSDGRTVGDLAARLSAGGHTAEVGWTLHPWARGQGYATEAAVALCAHLVDVVGVHRLEAHIHPGNAASRGVIRRLGMREEGVLRESFWIGDEVSDDAVFGLLAREWRASRPT